ncbi:MAG: glucosidase [Deltaproteobacteria bacterium]|nr:glucosidase [Deltaproteobacteria bacterium]
MLGISDNHQRLCFALALWNERDPILKERLFGLTGSQGNHGEDVKEYHFYLDSTPTHSYMKGLYKYPQAEFPYARLLEENARRSRHDPEFELLDTGVFDDDRYFDVLVEYAKVTTDDLLIRVTVTNRGPDPAPLHLLPTLWFRNTWAWDHEVERPQMNGGGKASGAVFVRAEHPGLGRAYRLYCEGEPELLFTENETNFRRLYRGENTYRFLKDAFHDYLVGGEKGAVNSVPEGTKAAAHYRLHLAPGQSAVVRLRLSDREPEGDPFGGPFERLFAQCQREADEFYATVIPARLSDDAKRVMRQALGGMLWSKQWYHYDVRRWLEGDPTQPAPPPERRRGRNQDWTHLYNEDVTSMPDKWEYPWYAAWDLHPNGQIPAYEWAFGDVNPPVHAWAAWRVYKIEKRIRGTADRGFLERVFHKLLLNFTWWVNRKDPEGHNVFQGGFLGLDNIGVFDRSAPLPTGGHIEQSDGTAWMGMFCLNMLAIALELAREDPAYEDVASKFFEHFVYIACAINNIAGEGIELWNKEDGFFYDVLHLDGAIHPLRVRSMVGLIPLFAVETLEPEIVMHLPNFSRRMMWFLQNRPELRHCAVRQDTPERQTRRLLSMVHGERLASVLRYLLDEQEFLSPYGVRALSRYHQDHPYVLTVNGQEHRVQYEPAESATGLFGGNSNWRGPIWFPVNYLLIESLQKFDHFYGHRFQIECPTGSGRLLKLWDVAAELSRRLTRIFLRGPDGRRPVHGGAEKFQTDPQWRDLILFYEYFHGDNGAGIGASHQTGWTGLVAKLLQQSGE